MCVPGKPVPEAPALASRGAARGGAGAFGSSQPEQPDIATARAVAMSRRYVTPYQPPSMAPGAHVDANSTFSD
jgi:hypothetical protein